MPIDVVPFADEHLDAAGELLAARHEAHRADEPALPERFADPAHARAELNRVKCAEELEGVAAIRDGRLVGYMLGGRDEVPSTSFFAPFVRPGAANVPFVGHAVDPQGGGAIYQQLYAALAARWVASGFLAHYVTIPAHDRAMFEAWSALGFGQQIALTVRGTNQIGLPEPRPDVEVRRASPDDGEAVKELSVELFRTFAEPPIFIPLLPEVFPDLCEHVLAYLADPASPIWLASRNGRVEAMQIFLTPESPAWFLSPIVAPERSIYLFFACTAASARGSGVNTALFARTMEWAAEAGYDYCTLHHLTASRAANYWRAQGCRPVYYWLVRQLDSRIAKA